MAILQVSHGALQSSRPAAFAGFNPTWPLRSGLQAFVRADRAGGVRDYVRNYYLPGTYDPTPFERGGSGLTFNAAGEGAQITAPDPLRLTLPFAIACWIKVVGTIQANAGIFGCVPNNGDLTPFISYGWYLASTTFAYKGNNAGTLFTRDTGVTPVLNTIYLLVANVHAGDVDAWINNVRVITASGSLSNPTFAASALFHVANQSGVSRNSNLQFLDGFIWNRLLAQGEVNFLNNNHWAHYAPSGATYASIGGGGGGGNRRRRVLVAA
jgi:hypothetical protein